MAIDRQFPDGDDSATIEHDDLVQRALEILDRDAEPTGFFPPSCEKGGVME